MPASGLLGSGGGLSSSLCGSMKASSLPPRMTKASMARSADSGQSLGCTTIRMSTSSSMVGAVGATSRSSKSCSIWRTTSQGSAPTAPGMGMGG